MIDRSELDELKAEVAALRAELRRVATTSPPAELAIENPDAHVPVSRRRWIQAAAGAAVAGTAVALRTTPAAAAVGDNVRVGFDTATTVPTTVTFTGAEDIGFLVRSGGNFGPTSSSVDAALAGWSFLDVHPVGVYGYTQVTTAAAAGVEGHSVSELGVGVRGVARRSQGTGVHADGGNGSTGVGVRAEGGTAVDASGVRYGAVVTGGRSGLRLGATNVAPAVRLDEHIAGEIDASPNGADDVDVWVCVRSGTPGTWRKLAGTAAAGAFHAINPVRAYDSRAPLPAVGALSGGEQRVVSVKDGRDLATGAVNAADAVPAEATAIAYNLTVTGTSSAGFLAVTPGDAAAFAASAINWSGNGVTVANAGIVKLDALRRVKVFAGGGGSTDFIIDITGYFL